MNFDTYTSLLNDYKAVVWLYGVFICMDWEYNTSIIDNNGKVVSQPTIIN